MKIYLAGPFFNEKQTAIIAELEELLRYQQHEVFSPREGSKVAGGLGSTAAERRMNAQKIFNRNIDAMEWADFCVAVIDDFDTGTVWEMGYMYARGKATFSYSSKGHGLNIMLIGSVMGHCKGMKAMAQLSANFTANYIHFQDFSKDEIEP